MDDALTRTGAARGQRCALPTARAFAHMPTACDPPTRTRKPGRQYTVLVYMDRLASRRRSQAAPGSYL